MKTFKIESTDKGEPTYWIEKHPDLPVVPFCLIATGRSRSGKSTVLQSLLGRDDMLKADKIWGKNVFLFIGTKGLNRDYEDIVPEKNIYDGFDQNKILEIIQKQENIIRTLGKKYANQVLILLEDVADISGFNNSRLLQRLAFRGRHALISLVISTQKLSSVPRGVRLNATYMIAFNPSGSESDWYTSELFKKADRPTADRAFQTLWNEPYAFLLIDNMTKDPKRRFRKGFSELIPELNGSTTMG